MAEVYKITNNVTKQIYIGMTSKTTEYRYAVHIRDSRCKSYKFNKFLFLSMRKYGLNTFSVECLCRTESIEDAKSIECFLIKEFELNKCKHPNGIGFNMTDGGDGNHGYIFTDEVKTRMSKAAKEKFENGYKHPKKGVKMTEEQLEKHKENSQHGADNHRYGKPGFWSGKKRSEESRSKTSKTVRHKIQKSTLVYAVIWDDGTKELIFGLSYYADKIGIPIDRMRNYAAKGIRSPLGFRVYKMIG